MNASYRPFFNVFHGKTFFEDPYQDNAIYGIVFSQNPMITTNTIWYSLPEAMRIAMNQ